MTEREFLKTNLLEKLNCKPSELDALLNGNSELILDALQSACEYGRRTVQFPSHEEIEQAAHIDYRQQTKWDEGYSRTHGFIKGAEWMASKLR